MTIEIEKYRPTSKAIAKLAGDIIEEARASARNRSLRRNVIQMNIELLEAAQAYIEDARDVERSKLSIKNLRSQL